MTLSSRHRIRNSSPGGLRPSTLPLGHNTDFHTWMGKKHFVSFKPPRLGTEPRTLAWKAAVLTTPLGPPPNRFVNRDLNGIIRHNKVVLSFNLGYYSWVFCEMWTAVNELKRHWLLQSYIYFLSKYTTIVCNRKRTTNCVSIVASTRHE